MSKLVTYNICTYDMQVTLTIIVLLCDYICTLFAIWYYIIELMYHYIAIKVVYYYIRADMTLYYFMVILLY